MRRPDMTTLGAETSVAEIVANENQKGPDGQLSSFAVNRAANKGYRLGKAAGQVVEAEPEPQFSGTLAEFADAFGVKFRQPPQSNVHGKRIYEGEGPYDELGLDKDLEERLKGIHLTPDHMPVRIATWFVYHSASAVLEQPEQSPKELCQKLAAWRAESCEPLPGEMSNSELGALAATVLVAQQTVLDFYGLSSTEGEA